MVFPVTVINDAYASFRIPLADSAQRVIQLLGWSAAPLWVHLHLLFPRARKTYLLHRKTVLAAVYLPTALLVAMNLAWDGRPLQILSVLMLTVYFAAGFVLLGRSRRHAESLLERRQARLVTWGSAPGFLVFLLLAWIQIVLRGFFQTLGLYETLAIINVQFLFILFAPLSIANAMSKYRLHEVENRYRRGTMFLFVNAFLLALFVAAVYGIGQALSRFAGIGGTTPVLIISLSLAVGFSPAQRKLRNSIEDRFFPERKRLRALLTGFLDEARGVRERAAFWSLLGTRLADGLEAEPVIPVIRHAGDPSTLFIGDEETEVFQAGDEFVQRLCSEGRPLLIDELIASGRIHLGQGQRNWFISGRIALLLPLPVHGGVLGFVAVGRKKSGDDYRAFELDTLSNLARQFAIAAENIELLEEKVEKEKLQEQLSIAKSIQLGLLPGSVPETPGLDVSATVLFCLDVAGDYYDIVPLESEKTLFAVGDATGKGVGPALLMANLQAALRSISDVGLPLADMITRINHLVYANTSSEFFITLFAAVFDPSTGELEWVNAGHNPPILRKASGDILMLWDGGLLLGVSEGADYRSGRIVLERGDVLAVYSDGLTEAMDGDEEEYGEDRLVSVLRRTVDRDACGIVGDLVEDVKRFHGEEAFSDDFTLMVVRRL
jgi:sigma-B regulation protein RsbU (phosphoserine phosphatase)